MPIASIKPPKPARRKTTKGVHGRAQISLSGKKSGTAQVSLYERLKKYAGTISGPGDLSTNPKYMEGYGRSRSH